MTTRTAPRQSLRATISQLPWTAIPFAVSLGYFLLHRMVVAPPTFSDLRVYRIEGIVERHGGDLYARLPGYPGYATYPPFAAICFVPFSLLPLGVVDTISFIANLLLLAFVVHRSLVFAGVSRDASLKAGLGIATVALWSEPVYMTFGYGQINLVLLALVLWDFSRPDSARTRGIGLGIAAGLKVTPGVFIIYLFLTRRIRFAVTASATFAATIVVSYLLDPTATRRFWTDYLFDVGRVGRLENAVNQTMRGFLTRVAHTRETTGLELTLIPVVAVLGLTCAVVAFHRLGEAWGLYSCAVTGLLCSPIAWSHHWVWCVPIGVLLWYAARTWAVVAVVVFSSWAVWFIPHKDGLELHLAWWQIAVSAWYVLFGLAFLGLTARRSYVRA